MRNRPGFTLTELLTVLGVVGFLVGVLAPAVQAARAAAARAACQNGLRQLGLALHAYHDANGGLPPRPVRHTLFDPNDQISWMGLILPQLGEEPLWTATVAACRADSLPFHAPPHTGYASVIPAYVCPSDGRLRTPLTDAFGVTAGYGSYVGVLGVRSDKADGALGPSPGVRLADIRDGCSTTLLIAERPPPDTLQAGRWYTGTAAGEWGVNRGPDVATGVVGVIPASDPICSATPSGFSFGRTNNPCDRYHLWSLHPGGANFALCDGSVRFLPYSAASVLPALATRAGGEAVSPPD